MDAFTIAALVALGLKFVDFIKYATNRNVNALVTQLAVWGSGIAIVFLASAANIASTLNVADMALQDMNGWSKVLVGLGLLSVGSVVYDFKKSVDGTDSAATPALLPNSPPRDV